MVSEKNCNLIKALDRRSIHPLVEKNSHIPFWDSIENLGGIKTIL